MRTRDGGVETGYGDSSETGSVMKEGKQILSTDIKCSLIPDFRDKEVSNIYTAKLQT